VPPRTFWIALPDSFLVDTGGLREKTVRVGMIARAAAIFQVTRVYIYRHAARSKPGDLELIRNLLEYLDLPQYLRRRLYPKAPEFSYAGLLPPLRTPPHLVPSRMEDVKLGDHREGIVIRSAERLMVDIGLHESAILRGRGREGERVTVRITSISPTVQCELSSRDELPGYWGYRVYTSPSLLALLKQSSSDITLVTSRRGVDVASNWARVLEKLSRVRSVLVVFGSNREGVFEILRQDNSEPHQFTDLVLNLFPEQGAATVRVEEAVLGGLAVLNVAGLLA